MLRDTYQRPMKDLRISVTDRCNFRCTYCMPFAEYAWNDKQETPTFEEIIRLARLFIQLGVEKINLTGGEPLLRRGLDKLIGQLSTLNGLKDLCLTTNGSLLAEQAPALAAAGLRRIDVSLDTLDPEKFRRMTGRGDLARVLDGLSVARSCGLHPIKINAVVERGVNDDEIIELVEFSRRFGFGIRFIEYMDTGNANCWISEKVVSKKEILEAINSRFALREVGRDRGRAPSVDYRFLDGNGDVGVIASVTEPFCSSCTRARLTAGRELVTCLSSNHGHDLKTPLRTGAADEQIIESISAIRRRRLDRYSDVRLTAMNSPQGYQANDHQKIEMITLGG